MRKMEIYKNFAAVYDIFMTRDIPYDQWAAYIHAIISQDNTADDPVLDLGCGTGNLTLRLAAMGHDMIGVDRSEDMLAEAQSKAFEAGRRILWLAQDMQQLDLYGTVRAAVCTCDALNYLPDAVALRTVFARVRLFLRPGGTFIFDMNTEYKYREVMGARTFGGMEGPVEYIWENHYNPAEKSNEYRVSFRIEGDEPTLFDETHRQQAHDPTDVTAWLGEAGFAQVSIFDGYSHAPIKDDTVRAVFVCK